MVNTPTSSVWTPRVKKMLFLEALDMQIMDAIPTAKSLQEIARETKIPRTSVAYNLKNLVGRGLVETSKYGKRLRYIALTNSKLVEYVEKGLDEINIANTEKKGARIKPTKENEFIIYIGIKDIVPAYARIAAENKNERVKAIQHHRSYREIFEKASAKLIEEFNDAIRKNNIIVDGILNNSAYKDYMAEIKANPDKYKSATEGLNERSADYHVFADNLFDYDAEIWLFKSTTLLINWHEEVAIEITNASMTGFIRDMFEFVKAGSVKIDHNKMMRELIDGLKLKSA